MEQHVIAAELSATGAQELLAATSAAHLAYNAENGTPRVIPVGFFCPAHHTKPPCGSSRPE